MDKQISQIHRDEHAVIGGVSGKKVFVVDTSGNVLTFSGLDEIRHYEYMGSQTIGIYTYFGFKEVGTVEWKIMQADDTNDGIWQFAYSESSANSWTTAWATPAGESYANPPDA